MKVEKTYKLYKKRFFIAFIACIGNFINAAIWCSFQAITPSASEYYRTSLFGINSLSTVFPILYIIFAPISSWLIELHGFSRSVVLGIVLNILGAVVRLIADYLPPEDRFITCFLGQSFAAVGQPFLLDCKLY
jgi:MFS family permease